jgi:hypothetical protein
VSTTGVDTLACASAPLWYRFSLPDQRSESLE